MHRLKCLDFDNQMATFPSSSYDCELPDLNLDRNKYSSPHWKHDPNRPHSKMNPNPNLNTFSWKALQRTGSACSCRRAVGRFGLAMPGTAEMERARKRILWVRPLVRSARIACARSELDVTATCQGCINQLIPARRKPSSASNT